MEFPDWLGIGVICDEFALRAFGVPGAGVVNGAGPLKEGASNLVVGRSFESRL
jgi:hypothetical protein